MSVIKYSLKNLRVIFTRAILRNVNQFFVSIEKLVAKFSELRN
jgi:hypothetical protein